MVTPDKKKHTALRRKGKVKIVEAIVGGPEHAIDKRPKADNSGLGASSIVSAFVFENKTAASPSREGFIPPINASVYNENPFEPTFTFKLRNLIEYAFECVRDSVSDQTPMTPHLERSIAETKSLVLQAGNRLNSDMRRRLNELIEETQAFIRGEKTALTNIDDYQGVLHYRHYVRIAWLTHFILNDLDASGL
jgi:hypothetical protein